MLKRCAAIVLMLSLMLASGCKGQDAAAAVAIDSESVRQTVTVASPEKAVAEIYSSLKSYNAESIEGSELKESFGIDESSLIEYCGMISDADDGLADVVIILPKENMRDDIQLALSKYKEQRITEFEKYDILDAYSIAQNAVIYDQGDYVIMLMLLDNDAARKIIDEHIPL